MVAYQTKQTSNWHYNSDVSKKITKMHNRQN